MVAADISIPCVSYQTKRGTSTDSPREICFRINTETDRAQSHLLSLDDQHFYRPTLNLQVQGEYLYFGIVIEKPIPVTFEFETDCVICSDSVFDEFGVGEDIFSAYHDYLTHLTEYYNFIKEAAESGNEYGQARYFHISKFIRPYEN